MIRSLLFNALLTTPLFAQQPDVSMKIDLVAWGDDIGGLSLKSGETKSNITALAFRYSKPVSYRGTALMEIFKYGDGGLAKPPAPTSDDKLHELMPLKPEPEPSAQEDKSASSTKTSLALELEERRKKEPALVALAQLPSNCSRATVLLAPSPDGTFVAHVIDDDPSRLPPGQLRIHNLSPHTIAMRVNGRNPEEIKTRGSLVFPANNQQVVYELAYKRGGEWQFQENNVIPVREEEQTQMIVLRSTNQFFRSADGSSAGFLQLVTLRRNPRG